MPAPLLLAEGLTKVFRRSLRRPRWVAPASVPAGRSSDPDPAGAEAGATKLVAVNNVGLTLQRGDVFGFLGPNGAGKSTTIRMILGLIHPTAGRVSIDGHDLATERLAALRKVGAFVEAPAFYGYLSGRKNLEIFAGLSGGVANSEIDRVLTQVGLPDRADELVKVYSHGMRQRLGIAACLLPRPELLVLDEPTDGLDPHGIRETRELILRLVREEGLTIFLSSHMLGEVENLCTHILMLERGTAILSGRLDEIERNFRSLEVTVDRPEAAAGLLREKLRLEATVCEGGLRLPAGTDAAAANAALVGAGFAVRSIGPENGWLDRLFLEKTTSRESLLVAPASVPAGRDAGATPSGRGAA
ncbi:MAG TPA: ABC transporter ATP-binding protein [Planctomycetota bacterium]|jgi:ABC-2 type transport system ATP-binding protein